ncbi:hypothetical protein STEG23_010519 [Scotinomys teguina]
MCCLRNSGNNLTHQLIQHDESDGMLHASRNTLEIHIVSQLHPDEVALTGSFPIGADNAASKSQRPYDKSLTLEEMPSFEFCVKVVQDTSKILQTVDPKKVSRCCYVYDTMTFRHRVQRPLAVTELRAFSLSASLTDTEDAMQAFKGEKHTQSYTDVMPVNYNMDEQNTITFRVQ